MVFDFAVPEIQLGYYESLIINFLTIVLLSEILSEYFIKITNTKSRIARIVSFLLLLAVFYHLVFIQQNSIADSMLIIAALVVSFLLMVIKKAFTTDKS